MLRVDNPEGFRGIMTDLILKAFDEAPATLYVFYNGVEMHYFVRIFN